MREPSRPESFLVTDREAADLLGGADVLDAHIGAGRVKAIPLNDRPGSPTMFPRSVIERLAARREKHNAR